MSTLFGIWHPDGRPVSPETLGLMAEALNHWQADAADVWREGPVGLGHLMLYETPESRHEPLPFRDADGGLVITADARLDNRDALARALGLDGPTARALPDSRYILHAYRRWGAACPAHLRGDFAFAIWDAPRQTLFCARDHVGVRPFYYTHANGRFAFATEIKGLLAVPGLDRSTDPQWVADALLSLNPDRTGTYYRHIRRLEPAHTLTVSARGVRLDAYWRFDPGRRLRLASPRDYVEGFREKLEEAVRVRLRSDHPVGAELSGGLDSSGVAALAHRLLAAQGRALTTFTDVMPPQVIGQDPLLRDERGFAEALIRHAGIEDARFVTAEAESLLDTLDWATRLFEEPPKYILPLYVAPLFRAVQARGVRTLLSGFGGDNMVTSPGSGYREDLLRRGAWLRLWRIQRASTSGPAWRTVRGLARLALREFLPDVHGLPFPYFTERANRDEALRHFHRRAFNGTRIEAAAQARRYRTHRLARQRGTLNRRLVRAFDHPGNVVNRLESAATASGSFRVSYRYPLLDVDLMAFYLAVPSELKRSARWGRYLYRLSIEGLVPEQIQWREDKTGWSSPSSIYRLHQDYERLLEACEAECSADGVGRYIDLAHSLAQQRAAAREKRLKEITTFKLLLADRIVRRAEASSSAVPAVGAAA